MNLKRNLLAAKAAFKISMKIYFRYPLNFILTFFDPIIWITPFYFMGKSFSSSGVAAGFRSYTGNSDYIGFLVIGYMVSSYISASFWSLGFSLKNEMMQGVLESNWSAPVNRINLLISKGLFQFVATTFENIFTGIVCHFVFGFTINNNILKFLLYLIPGIIAMIGLGIAISALVLIAKEANSIIDFSNSMVSALSGGFFPIKVLPRSVFFISMLIPLTYINDSSRAILINQVPIMPLKYQFIIIVASMFVFIMTGSAVFYAIEKKCREMGLLSTH